MKKAISGLLAVWLSGFVFLFCCGTMPFQAAEPEFCPLAKTGGHCNKGKKPSDAPKVAGESSTSFNCCEFLPKVFDRFRNVEKAQKSVQPADKILIERPQFVAVQTNYKQAQIFHQSIFPKEKIHIKNCIFRI